MTLSLQEIDANPDTADMCEYITLIRIKTIPFCAKSLLSVLTVLAVAGDGEVGRIELGHPLTSCCQHTHFSLLL